MHFVVVALCLTEENKYRPTYKFPEDISDTKSEEGKTSLGWGYFL